MLKAIRVFNWTVVCAMHCTHCTQICCNFSRIPYDLIYYMTKFGQFPATNKQFNPTGWIDSNLSHFGMQSTEWFESSIIQLHLNGMLWTKCVRFVACALFFTSFACQQCCRMRNARAKTNENNGYMKFAMRSSRSRLWYAYFIKWLEFVIRFKFTAKQCYTVICCFGSFAFFTVSLLPSCLPFPVRASNWRCTHMYACWMSFFGFSFLAL